MNIINKLTLRHMKLNKKRTLITIIGVIISAAMITAVATLRISFMDLKQRQSISDEGEWHVIYKDINNIQLQAVKNDKETKQIILSRDTGYALLKGSQNASKPYMFIGEYNKEGFEKFPIELSKGRFPKAANEVVISDAIIDNAKVNYKIGDLLTVDIGKRCSKVSDDKNKVLTQYAELQKGKGTDTVEEFLTKEKTKTYKIVGVIKRPKFEPTWAPGYTVLSCVDENTITSKEKINASIILKDINGGLFSHAKSIASQNKIETVKFNDNLLRFYGVVKDDTLYSMILTLSAIMMIIIMVGSVSLIYNAFAISVSERSRHLGMLSSVGATKKQKRDSVFFEGAVVGLISIPTGIICGFLGMDLTFLCINYMIKGALGITESFRVVVSPLIIIIAIVVSATTILISTYIPARKASRISAIDAIRQTSDIKLTGKEVKISKLTKRIFGVEGTIGLKNLKRNKGRYKATVFSLVISMILFLSVIFFTSDLKKSTVLSQEGINFDINISLRGENVEAKNNTIKKINSLGNITDCNEIDTFDARVWINKEFIADYLKGEDESIMKNGEYPYYVSVNALNDEALKSYAKEVGGDFDSLKDEIKPSAIVIDTTKYKDMQSKKYVETKAVKISRGQKLDLMYQNWESENDVPLVPVEITLVTDKLPVGILSEGKKPSFNIVVSKEVFDKIVSDNKKTIKDLSTSLFIKSNDPMALQVGIETIRNAGEVIIGSVQNLFMNRQKDNQTIVLMSVFAYGFIALITAICVANILNTISTSVALRKREFAMLKSIGMTPKSFNKMINYESIFYGIKALLYGLPISITIMYLIHRTLMEKFSFKFTLPWISILLAVAAVFIIVGVSMLYSSAKVKKGNIIDALKNE
ncbi:FtsX-like permease family protein [Clostridium estertheticum]|uniref:ABC transporter permease n=1 Tax=Clostridium estertheticum TaxID=238834 RepID=UPI0013E90F47|nr:FtsX-like permease family protein [Clostridium estertheticum]MBZ9685639.1 FtsX-like permease family protein [Clostridium estertheticum]